MLNKDLMEIRRTLVDMAEKEATKLYRLARNLQKRGGSAEVIARIREEAFELHMSAYPERLIAGDARYRFQYAFRC